MRVLLVAVTFLVPLPFYAQTSDPSFEVASVKPNESGQRNSRMDQQPTGRFTATNVTLLQLITRAHGLRHFQIVGAPEWASSERFDVVATAEENGTESKPGTEASRLSLMLRSLLIERFILKTHTETRELPTYALVLARSDKRLGPQLAPSAIDCVALRKSIPAAAPSPGASRPCVVTMAAGRIVGGSMLIADLATQLSLAMQGIVEDRTGLTGRFDFQLLYAAQVSAGGVVTNSPALSPSDSDRLSLFTALQEQLGLKLESARGAVDVLVIDHVDRPTPD